MQVIFGMLFVYMCMYIYVYVYIYVYMRFLGGSDSKASCPPCGRPRFDPWVGKIPWRRKWQPTSVLLLRKFHGWRSLVGYSPWGRKESDTAE